MINHWAFYRHNVQKISHIHALHIQKYVFIINFETNFYVWNNFSNDAQVFIQTHTWCVSFDFFYYVTCFIKYSYYLNWYIWQVLLPGKFPCYIWSVFIFIDYEMLHYIYIYFAWRKITPKVIYTLLWVWVQYKNQVCVILSITICNMFISTMKSTVNDTKVSVSLRIKFSS